MANYLLYRLWLMTRQRLIPDQARYYLRLGKHVFQRGQSSSWLPPELVADCKMCASRNDLVSLLPKGGRLAEVGTLKGQFAKHILDVCRPKELHLIDLDFSRLDPAVRGDARVALHAGHSHKVLAEFEDSSLDWIYIDADHSYAGVSRDAKSAAPKVKPGGYLVFNDFAHADPFLGAYGVHRAVVDFAIKQSWPFAWFAYNTWALYDVALRRPQIPN